MNIFLHIAIQYIIVRMLPQEDVLVFYNVFGYPASVQRELNKAQPLYKLQ